VTQHERLTRQGGQDRDFPEGAADMRQNGYFPDGEYYRLMGRAATDKFPRVTLAPTNLFEAYYAARIRGLASWERSAHVLRPGGFAARPRRDQHSRMRLEAGSCTSRFFAAPRLHKPRVRARAARGTNPPVSATP